MRRYVLIGLALAVLLLAGTAAWLFQESEKLPPELENILQLRDLPANRWVKYHEERPGTWSRQAHAGIAFDSRRGSLLIFGSDTHGEDWEHGENRDNAVHEFQPSLKKWVTHYAEQGPETYRADDAGRPVAGTDTLLPWAMHTYDAIEYHPGLDALIITSTTEHAPKAWPASEIRQQPTWIYDLSSHSWRVFPNNGDSSPSFFGGSSAYDAQRDVLIAYRGALWELDTAAGKWHRVANGHHQLHHTMAYAAPHGTTYVFGDYQPTTAIWAYRPGTRVGAPGSWEKHQPGGDPCPPYTTVPVAYVPTQDVFVLVVDPVTPGQPSSPKPSTASTYLYNPTANTYQKLPEGDMAPVGMNFMMAWDSIHEVVFLITGGPEGVVTVWAMRPRKEGRQ